MRSWVSIVLGSVACGAMSPMTVCAQPCMSWVQRDDGTGSGLSRRATVAPMAYDSVRSELLLFGGQDLLAPSGYVFFNDVWTWDGTDWSEVAVTGVRPVTRSSGGVAFDRVRDRLVIFGGYRSDVARSRDTWELDRTTGTWSNVSNSGPTPRYEPGMVYDEARSVCVLFGGNTGAYSNETWTWNGTVWTRQLPLTSPPGRSRPMMAYDSARSVVVVFGGQAANVLTDTWEWNGMTWTQRATSGPPARIYQGMTFDRDRGVAVLHAGNASPVPSGSDVWEWDGTTWTMRTLPGISSRYAQGIGYDEARQEVVVFGGIALPLVPAPNATLRDTWVFTPNDLGVSSPDSLGNICLDGGAVFSVVAYADQPATYAWRRDGMAIADGPTGTGSTMDGSGSATLTISGCTSDDEAAYNCVVSNDCGSVTSAAASLVVCEADFNCDALLNSQDFFDFLAAFFDTDPSADFNRDGVVNSQDFFDFLTGFFGGC